MFKKILEKLTSGNTLYYPGCMTKFVLPDVEKKYMELLKKFGIEFMVLKHTEQCCGSPIINGGYKEEFDKLVDKNIEIFKKHGISKIITNCPGCYNMFKEHYPFKVEHITQTIMKNLDKLELKHSGKITFHDPCHLGRYSEIYDEPRKILEHIGFEIVEMKESKEQSMCCGAGGGLRNNAPKLAAKIAKKRLDQAPTELVTTVCTMCYYHLKENAPENTKVLELVELLI